MDRYEETITTLFACLLLMHALIVRFVICIDLSRFVLLKSALIESLLPLPLVLPNVGD